MFQQPDHRAKKLDAGNVFVHLRSPENPTSPPLFCVHPSGRDVGIYRKLARTLNSDIPVIGIRPAHLDGEGAAHVTSLDDLAELYSELINQEYPTGPIRLLGFSLGGFIATIMSSILKGRRREVSFLGMIDSDLRWAVDADLAKREFTLRIKQLALQLQDIGALPTTSDSVANAVVAELAEMSFENEVTADQVVQKLESLGHVADKKSEPMLIQLIESMALHCRLLQKYEPPAVSGPVHMWWPSQPPVADRIRTAQWQPHVNGEIIDRALEGSHYEVMRMPAVRTLASDIDAVLAANFVAQSV